jgi:hypothetical protein
MNSAALYSSLQALNLFHLIHPSLPSKHQRIEIKSFRQLAKRHKMWKKFYLKYSNKAFLCFVFSYLL